MPYKDPEDRKKSMRRWREKHKGYESWRHRRRQAHLADAKDFRQALVDIAAVTSAKAAHEIALAALAASDQRWQKLEEEREEI